MVVQKPALAGVYHYSMALVIMGGLLVSTFLTLVLLPASTTPVEGGLAWCARRLASAGRWFARLRPPLRGPAGP
jgi:hypothetical protein